MFSLLGSGLRLGDAMADRFPRARSMTRVSESERAAPERFDPATMNGLIAAEHLARYWLAADLARGLEVLDAGCGVGYGAEMIARAGASRVVGIDLEPEAIATASERAGEMADFQVGDVQDLPFDEGSFDLVVCFEVLEHLEDPEPAITALKGVLREDGLLIVSSPNRGVYPPGNPHHLHEFTLEELRDALAARFANVVLMRQHPWLASLIDDGTLASPGEEAVSASVARAGSAVDAWTYVVALASDGAIDQPGAIGVFADSAELRRSSGGNRHGTGEPPEARRRAARSFGRHLPLPTRIGPGCGPPSKRRPWRRPSFSGSSRDRALAAPARGLAKLEDHPPASRCRRGVPEASQWRTGAR